MTDIDTGYIVDFDVLCAELFYQCGFERYRCDTGYICCIGSLSICCGAHSCMRSGIVEDWCIMETMWEFSSSLNAPRQCPEIHEDAQRMCKSKQG